MFTIAFQPFHNAVGKRSAALGGSAMGLTANDEHRLVLEINCLWHSKDDDSKLTEALIKQLTSMKAQAEGKISGYSPLFMNDAAYDQDVTGSYKEAEKFRKLQRQIDPQGIFAKRAGGFKYWSYSFSYTTDIDWKLLRASYSHPGANVIFDS